MTINFKFNILCYTVKITNTELSSRSHCIYNWGEPERAPHDQSNGDRVCLCVHRTFTFRIYACSNLTQMCNISLVQSDSTSRVQVHSQYSTAR